MPAPPTVSIVAESGQSSTAVVSAPLSQITPAPITIAAPLQSGPESPVKVTLDDNGKTLNMRVGESFLLDFGEIYTWEFSLSDQNGLKQTPDAGATSLYQALQPGTVTLSGVGDPLCRQSQPACGMPSILFTLTVVIK
jgi:hypothetical protein